MPGSDLGLALRIARRELRGGLKGFRIFLACLALGVGAIAAIGSASQAVLQGLRSEGRVILGGDMDLRLTHQQATEDQRRWLAARANVSEISTMRAMARGEGTASKRTLIELKAVDGLYPLFGQLQLSDKTVAVEGKSTAVDLPPLDFAAALAQRDGLWGAVVDAGVLRRLDVGLGETVKVGDAHYRLSAVLEREPDRGSRAFTLGPTFLVAAASLPDTGLIQPGSLVRYHYRLKLTPGITTQNMRQELARDHPEAGWRITDAESAAPRISRFVHRLTLFMTLIGLTALLVGGVGVGNAVSSYLERRTATIATLKCLGAPGGLIFRVYMVQIMALAGLGVAIGLGLGAFSPFAVAALTEQVLGWRPAAAVYPLPLLLAGVFGLLTAATFSLWPLARAGAIEPAALFRDHIGGAHGRPRAPMLAAIGLCTLALAGLAVATASDTRMAIYFVAGALAVLLIFRLAAQAMISLARRLGRPRQPLLRLALANLCRPGAPTASIVMSLGLGLTLLVAIALIEGNLEREIEQSLPEEAPGFYFIDIQNDQVEAFDTLLGVLPGVEGFERVPMLRGRITAVNGRAPSDIEIPPEIAWVFRGDRGLTWARQAPPDTRLVAGDWWPADYSGPPLVSLDRAVGEGLGIGPGDSLGINILGRDVEVTIANLRRIDWSDLSINFVMVFSPGLLEGAPQTHIAAVQTAAAAEDDIEIAVTNRFANVSSIRVKEALQQVAELMGHIAAAVRAIAAIAILAGTLVLAGALAAGQQRRIYDAVVLKVLGATRAKIAIAFALEDGLLGLATAGIAAILGSLTAFLVLTQIMRASFVLLPQAVWMTALFACVLTLFFGFAGTYRALGQKAAPLLRNE